MIEFEYVALVPSTQVYSTRVTSVDSLSEKQGWRVWRDEDKMLYFAQYRGGRISEIPMTSVRSALRKPEPAEEPKVAEEKPATARDLDMEQKMAATQAPPVEVSTTPETPKAKSKLPPRRGAAPVAEQSPTE